MKWNLEWLRTFKAIYETGTLSAAAQELFISQPGVSLHLNSLEAFTGHKLFDRSARRMVPTEKGKILYNYIIDPLKKLEIGEQHFHNRALDERITISIGMCFETFQYTLEEHIAQLPFNLIIKFGEYPQMQQDLDNGLLDLIITPQKGNQQNLVYQPFSKERIVLIAGCQTDTTELEALLQDNKIKEASQLLKNSSGTAPQRIWITSGISGQHILANILISAPITLYPISVPLYVVSAITKAFLLFLIFCAEAIASGKIKLVWEGQSPVENTLYFGTRKKTMYQEEISKLETLLQENGRFPY
ncbi:LysR family transcriptional regulator [Sphingobacterium sp. E70]|uniref:LysR family transcriptional regulator n=1 Tax=Sphingobacterium sp. E70 TaxID=2853439 RepID=UPI00211CCCA8|nr:LysR family transcriptional regulator [Sphingobacterium sp. E70]ULT23193.1 LysR family transcriptional regulator [Sphingobacterium sp. E70]